MTKGQTFTVTHSDGLVVTETVSEVKTEREEVKVNRYHHHFINRIIDTYYEVKRTTLVICESAAVYDVKEIN
jgi:pantothenate kinase